ncbi:hypothetical protein DDV21_002460 [Streptococcus chenjunshii]|uniref:Uncharacterized protein n=2 Tax=Streptococcus chenjunshii TaxID=2173853 RepID=A0A372KJP2_9STRE|nr:hypothetical protein DDV21_002460 [Streptococcus chenjunshii]RFU51861.1 hypothetical protein DDV22_01305 [Streptococcus chenjunshii]RFU52154.1 hypothetical protein DDV23_11185 [Streptococcus chenjunshii]
MEKEKVNQLYKHGFRLYEEQIATYIKENYSGISKIEFSPIFVDGDGRFTMRTVNVVPVVYDEEGNKAYLGRKVGNGNDGFSDFGIADGLIVDFDGFGEEVIELEDFETDKVYDVSGYETLPDFAKLKKNSILDENIMALIDSHQLETVEKSSEGSPDSEIVYNLEIREGDYTQWH